MKFDSIIVIHRHLQMVESKSWLSYTTKSFAENMYLYLLSTMLKTSAWDNLQKFIFNNLFAD